MKTTARLSLFLICLPLFVFSQSNVDSLLQQYKTGRSDAETFNLLAAAYFETNIDSGRYFAELALNYAQHVGDPQQIGEAYYQLGDACYYSDQADSTIYYYNLSLENYLKTEAVNEIAGVYNDIGQVLQMLNYHDSANLYFDLSLNYIDKEELPEGYYSILINKANAYYHTGDFPRANDIYKTILEEVDHSFPAYKRSVLYSNIGLNSKKMANYQEAIQYYEKALHIDDSLGAHYEMAVDYANIGGVYYSWKQYKEAYEHFNRSYEIHKTAGKKRDAPAMLPNMASALKALGNFSQARKLYLAALDSSLKMDDHYITGSAYHGLGMLDYDEGNYKQSLEYEKKAKQYFQKSKRIYALFNSSLSLARSATVLKKYAFAKSNLIEAEQYAQQSASLDMKKEIAMQWAKYYGAIGENKKSNEKYKLFIQLNDSIFNQKSHRLITEYNIKLKTLEKQKKLDEASLQNKINKTKISQKNLLIYILIGVLFIATILIVTIIVFYRQKQRSLQLLFEKSTEELKTAPKIDDCKKDLIKAGISDEVLKEILDKLHHKIDDEKIYLQTDLSIHKLAQQMETNTSYLSKIINEYYQQNFNSYINKYRIRAAQEMMQESKYRNYTIEAIAHECGFKSKSSFNEAFKKTNGITPGYYLQQIKAH